MNARRPYLFSLLFTICFGVTGWSQPGEQAEYQLHLARRINAHGDEFNAAALSGEITDLVPPGSICPLHHEWPSQIVRVRADGKLSSRSFPERTKWHASGRPADLAASVASSDGSTIWGIFRKGAALVQWKPKKKRAEILTMTHGSVYAMDALGNPDGSGLLLTGGDDGFARVWNLTDLSLRREFWMPIGVPQGVGLLADGRRALISCGTGEPPIDILIADIETGEMRRLLTLERPGAHVKGRHILLSNELEL